MDLLRSLPLGLYLEQPITWLHKLDSRVKIAWLMTFLLAPLLASALWRVGLVAVLILLTLSAGIPLRVWRQQMGWLLSLCTLILLLSALAPDGLPSEHKPRLPTNELLFQSQKTWVAPEPLRKPWYNPFGWGMKAPAATLQAGKTFPQPTDYTYTLFHQGPFKITRHSLDLAISLSTLYFTVIYSTNLYLLTTASEEITAGLENLMQPLRRFKVPVTEITLTLTLSLRFIPLVLEEVQNLVRSVWTRAINWKKLGLRGSAQVWLMVAERLLENLLLRAFQIASAMQVRGFTSPTEHRVEWHQLRLRAGDWIALSILTLFWAARFVWGWET